MGIYTSSLVNIMYFFLEMYAHIDVSALFYLRAPSISHYYKAPIKYSVVQKWRFLMY